MSVVEHKQKAPEHINCMVITVSDTRTEETDTSGQLMQQLLSEQGHLICLYKIVTDNPDRIRQAIAQGIASPDVEVILLNGGTGIAARDTTYETVLPLLDKEMPGFGELFRYLSYAEDIGSAAMLSRAVAGIVAGKALFATPGSRGAVRLAMNKLIIPEIRHVVGELRKDRFKREK